MATTPKIESLPITIDNNPETETVTLTIPFEAALLVREAIIGLATELVSDNTFHENEKLSLVSSTAAINLGTLYHAMGKAGIQ
ncbi:hypothetical protein LEBRON_73 [Mycobacterium phage LeBron]|uniref:Uncharacterized protein n=1 Tax=Mycobacterium phage LeBron TaxID=2919553 RepID=E0YPK6_9CAUD|nr:hypothetical protein LEBRON_73 [Mycobacterium phage LeBron]ADL71036.1 hypothetical protein LEBRON_73 [Mycobacterium phage LeBron]